MFTVLWLFEEPLSISECGASICGQWGNWKQHGDNSRSWYMKFI